MTIINNPFASMINVSSLKRNVGVEYFLNLFIIIVIFFFFKGVGGNLSHRQFFLCLCLYSGYQMGILEIQINQILRLPVKLLFDTVSK